MEKQLYNIGDIVKTLDEDSISNDEVIRIGKVVSVQIAKSDKSKFLYGVSFNLNGVSTEDYYLGTNTGDLVRWIVGKVKVTEDK